MNHLIALPWSAYRTAMFIGSSALYFATKVFKHRRNFVILRRSNLSILNLEYPPRPPFSIHPQFEEILRNQPFQKSKKFFILTDLQLKFMVKPENPMLKKFLGTPPYPETPWRSKWPKKLKLMQVLKIFTISTENSIKSWNNSQTVRLRPQRSTFRHEIRKSSKF